METSDETKRISTEAAQTTATDGVRSALSELFREMERLIAAMHHQDADGAELAATGAVFSWIAGKAALRRASADARFRDEQLLFSTFLLSVFHDSLVELLTCTFMQIDAPKLHQALYQLRTSLKLAKVESCSD